MSVALLDVVLPDEAERAPPDVQAQLRRTARRDILQRTYSGTFAYPAVALFLAAFGWEQGLPHAVSVAFVLGLTAIVLMRVALYRRAMAEIHVARWEGKGHLLLGMVSSFATALYGAVMVLGPDGTGSTIGLVVTVAIIATVVNIASPSKSLAYLWAGSLVLPTVPVLLWHGGLLGYGMAALFAMYSALVGSAIRLFHQAYWRGLLAAELLDAESKRTVALSRHAGMAEIATNVLHDVGNTLNSVKTAAAVLADLHLHDPADDLERVVGALRERSLPAGGDVDPSKLLEFLDALSQNAAIRRQAVHVELERLSDHLQHIEVVVRRQQEIAKGTSEVTRCSARELVDEALELLGCRHDPSSHGIMVDVPAGLGVRTDRHRTLQILLNLLHNAIEATRDLDHREIHIDVWRDDAVRVVFEVRDNGEGADAQTASRVFTRGFTTKRHGHGFGLHNASLIARAMGGTLSFESSGKGEGARLALALPAASSDRRHRTTKRLRQVA